MTRLGRSPHHRTSARGAALAGAALLIPALAPAASAARAAAAPRVPGLAVATAVDAQDSNVLEPPAAIEERLRHQEFEVLGMMTSRGLDEERTHRATLRFADGSSVLVKWAAAPRGGEAFNNRPRYEIAAYELQKLFLDGPDYVVPPTVARCIPRSRYREIDRHVPSTFSGADDILVVFQYWLWNVRGGEVLDEERLARDSVYARHLGNLNILSYLIRHFDSNEGNFLVSEDSANPRVFAVDNGLSFDSERSDRGTAWSRMRVQRLPRVTVERLRALDEERLDRALGVVAEFELSGGHLKPVPVSENLNPDRGTRWDGRVLQLGLTDGEIDDVHRRLERILEWVDEGELALF